MDKDRFYSAKPKMQQTVESEFPLGSSTSCISEDKNKNNVQNESISEKKGTVRCPLCEAFFQDESAVEMHMICAHNAKKEIVKTVIASLNELNEQQNSKSQPSAGTMQLDMNLTNTGNLSRLTNQEMDKDRFYSAKPTMKQTVESKFHLGSSTSFISVGVTEKYIRNESISENKGTLPCPLCEAFFLDESAVEMHMISTHKTHTGNVKTVVISFHELAEQENSKFQPSAGTRPFDMSSSSHHDMKLLEKMHVPNTDCPSNKEIYHLTQFPLLDPLQKDQDYLKQQALNSMPSTLLPTCQKVSRSSKQPCRNVSFKERFFQPHMLKKHFTKPHAPPFVGSETNTFQDRCQIFPNIPQKRIKETSFKSNDNSIASAKFFNTTISSVLNNVKTSNDKRKITDKPSKFTPYYVYPETAIQRNTFYPLNMMHTNYEKGFTTPINIGMHMNYPFAVANRLPPGMASPLMNRSIPGQFAPPLMAVESLNAQFYRQQLCQKQNPKWMGLKPSVTESSFNADICKKTYMMHLETSVPVEIRTTSVEQVKLKRKQPGATKTKRGSKRHNFFTQQQTQYLRQQFKECNFPTIATVENIASKIGSKKKSVRNWFQRTRARERKREFNSLKRFQTSSSLLDTSPCNAVAKINSGSINGPSPKQPKQKGATKTKRKSKRQYRFFNQQQIEYLRQQFKEDNYPNTADNRKHCF